ncbi:MAG: hypothetical protein R6U95_05760 [Bacteroidales bacterium]
MLQLCLQQAINKTEFLNRGLTQGIADDLSDRIALKTGHKIDSQTLYSMYRHTLSENDIALEDKNALAQFAQYQNWEHFVSQNSTPQKQTQKNFHFILYLGFFMLSIYILMQVVSYIFLQ